MKYNGKIEAAIRETMKLAITAAMQEALQRPLHVRVLDSTIMHTELHPEGDQFSMRFNVSVHPKKVEEKADAPG